MVPGIQSANKARLLVAAKADDHALGQVTRFGPEPQWRGGESVSPGAAKQTMQGQRSAQRWLTQCQTADKSQQQPGSSSGLGGCFGQAVDSRAAERWSEEPRTGVVAVGGRDLTERYFTKVPHNCAAVKYYQPPYRRRVEYRVE